MTEQSNIRDLTAEQKDFAIYLPAMCKPYMTGTTKDRRASASMGESWKMDYYKPGALFEYKWMLYSAGHASLDADSDLKYESMVHERDINNTFLLADSGGFQIGKGRWKGKWNDPKDKVAEKMREKVFGWLDRVGDYSMILDIPSWTFRDPEVAEKVGIYSFNDAITGTKFNNDYFVANQTKDSMFMNVLQGNTEDEVLYWYEQVKNYPFRGWAFGGQVARDLKIMLDIFVRLTYDGLLERGERDWVHVLGATRMHWGVALTKIMRVLREKVNPDLTISLDSASPFLSTVNAGIYTGVNTEDRTRWNIFTERAVDDKKYRGDTTNIAEKYEYFLRNPVSDHLTLGDICYTDDERKSSWDVQSYVFIMANNIWQHINAIQESNRRADAGFYTAPLINENFTRVTINDVVDEIFSKNTKEDSLAVVEKHANFLRSIPVGGQTKVSATPMFENLFEYS